ncbi:MAG: transcriptional repressor [Candidatus Woesearchaeota archaeon]
MKSRITRQKEHLIKRLAEIKGLFTAEEFFEECSAETFRIGIATIYRFLNEQEKINSIHSYRCDRKKVYSKTSTNHCHFICEHCGKREHISIKNIEAIRASTTGTICHFQIDVYGICKRCTLKKMLKTK